MPTYLELVCVPVMCDREADSRLSVKQSAPRFGRLYDLMLIPKTPESLHARYNTQVVGQKQ